MQSYLVYINNIDAFNNISMCILLSSWLQYGQTPWLVMTCKILIEVKFLVWGYIAWLLMVLFDGTHTIQLIVAVL